MVDDFTGMSPHFLFFLVDQMNGYRFNVCDECSSFMNQRMFVANIIDYCHIGYLFSLPHDAYNCRCLLIVAISCCAIETAHSSLGRELRWDLVGSLANVTTTFASGV